MLGTTVTLAFRAINRHKLRSFLTTLGIIIGVAAVVTMVTPVSYYTSPSPRD